uniref:Cationic amino acid transporter C-terminal domain-containing protein n=1 Tax=Davidia involucrata TaxID=16924 RepID=A0A5B7C2E7_DAVIN
MITLKLFIYLYASKCEEMQVGQVQLRDKILTLEPMSYSCLVFLCTRSAKLVTCFFHVFVANILNEDNRRKVAGWTIMLTCVGVLLLTSAALKVGLPSFVQFMLCGIGGTLLLSGLVVLTCIDQDDARHSFGHTGGFICPFVPLLPIACILINIYLLVNVGAATWTRVLIWLGLGAIVYVFYGRTHSSLIDAVYVPAAHVDEIYCSSTNSLA